MKTKFSLLAGLRYIWLTGIAITVTYPILWVFMSSIKDQNDFFLHPWGIPRTFNMHVYYEVIVEHGLLQNVLNSILIATLSVVFVTTLSAMAAYGITRMKWKLSKPVMGFLLLGILIPGHSTLIPLYINLQGLRNIIDPRLVLLIPYVAFGLPSSTFILSGYVSTLPKEIEESAVMDGYSLIQVFWRIVLPLCMPALATVGIFAFMGAWNELLLALVFLVNRDIQTIPVAILQFMGTYGTDWTKILASIAITMAPSILVYMFLQNKIIEGITSGSVKM